MDPATTLQRQARTHVLVIVVVVGDGALEVRRTAALGVAIQTDFFAVVDEVVRNGDVLRILLDVDRRFEGQVAIGRTIALVVHREHLVVIDPDILAVFDTEHVGIVFRAAKRADFHVLHDHVFRLVHHNAEVGRRPVRTHEGHARSKVLDLNLAIFVIPVRNRAVAGGINRVILDDLGDQRIFIAGVSDMHRISATRDFLAGVIGQRPGQNGLDFGMRCSGELARGRGIAGGGGEAARNHTARGR